MICVTAYLIHIFYIYIYNEDHFLLSSSLYSTGCKVNSCHSFLSVVFFFKANNLKDTWYPRVSEQLISSQSKAVTFLGHSGPVQCIVYITSAKVGIPPLP